MMAYKERYEICGVHYEGYEDYYLGGDDAVYSATEAPKSARF